MGRRWFEVRVREQEGSGREVKKSKFYFATDSKDAGGKYKGKGYIMSVEKADRDKLLGINSFFRLGDLLLEDLKGESKKEETKDKTRKKRYFNRQRREQII